MFSIKYNTNLMSHGNLFVTRAEFKRMLLLCCIACYVHANTWPNFFGHTSTSFPYYNSHNTAITTVNYTFSPARLVSFRRTFISNNQHPT